MPLVKSKSPASSQVCFLSLAIAISTLVLFISSSVRHGLFQSSFDLAIFDNAVYLISQGQTPFITFRNLHILGDHAAWIVYPLALLYKIYPDIHWLFLIQALSLAIAALPLWYLSQAAGLRSSRCQVVVLAYLLYPAIFNVNLFDFHPEVIAVPAIFGAILAAKRDHLVWFIASIILILSCKAVLALTVVGIGLWLLLSSKYRYHYAIIAIVLGSIWFAIATQIIIPSFSGAEAAAVDRYGYLGDSVWDIAKTLLIKPNLVLGQIFSPSSFGYLLLLTAPLLWGLSPLHLMPLVGAMPILLINLLSESDAQRNLVHQYSLPIIPWLLVIVIISISSKDIWLKSRRNILIWSLVAWLALAKYGYFGSIYLQTWDTWRATSQALALIDSKGGVLTTSDIAPHLTHRELLGLPTQNLNHEELAKFAYVLLNLRHPGWGSSSEIAEALFAKLKQSSTFQLKFQQDDVFLFTKVPGNQ
ncbi:MAG: DUF2079 domain-containing protein [Cyanobacteria bacterium J06638_38]